MHLWHVVTVWLLAFGLAPASAAAEEPREAILAGGCFWCVEADFDAVPGVLETISGYIGGTLDHPTYENHKPGGHLQAVRVRFDPAVIDYRGIVDVFWRTIDVTDDGGQFCDRGNAYRAAVFVASEAERAMALASKRDAEAAFGAPFVTRILDATTFWPAEEFHQDYYLKHPIRYQVYRFGCGRDRRIREIWGDEAFMGLAKN
ncbi:MAG: peptide-methionine (S)-S-oxide reductase [Geminicoccaceae bacterium]|nr:MAG: peptide-methionine (S)-S-oxide reductase [Geminicoccaceae bacterium]